jgi:trimeric autotransporter adhesin
MPISTIGSNSLNQTSDLTINGQTVGKGGGNVATNTVHGYQALNSNTTGATGVAIGYQAGYTNSTGPHNTFVGAQAGYSSTGGENTCVGRTAGYSISTGTGNTFVGPGNGATSNGAGYYVTTGSKNTIIGGYNGNQGSLDIRTASNYIVLSDGDGNPRGYFDNSGYFTAKSTISGATGAAQLNAINTGSGNTGYGAVQVGNSTGLGAYLTSGDSSATSQYWYHAGAVTLAATSGGAMYFRVNANDSAGMLISTNGSIGAPTGTNIYNASDARLKKNIQPLTKGLDAINALKPVSFNWITDFCKEENDKTLYGFVAQDTKEVDENLVEGFNNGGDVVVGDLTVEKAMRVNEKFIIPMLVKAIQELKTIVDAQAAEIAELKAKVA